MRAESEASPASSSPSNGKPSLEEALAMIHQDLEINFQTARALIDVLCELRDQLRLVTPMMRDARLILADVAESLRKAEAQHEERAAAGRGG